MSDIPPLPPGYENYRLNVPAPNPLQVPGGTAGQAATAGQELAKQSASEEQTRNYGLYTGGLNLAGSIHNASNLIDQAEHAGIDFGATDLWHQILGQGGGQIAHLSRLSQIGTGIGDPEKAQRAEIVQDALGSALTDVALKRQAYARVSRGGGQTEANATGSETQGGVGRGNVAQIRGMIGDTSQNTAAGLKAKLHQQWNDVFDGMGQAITNDPKSYTTQQAIRDLSSYGFSPTEIKQGIENRRYPGDLLPAGGAPEKNRTQYTPPAESPHKGKQIDQEGTEPAPQGNPGRGPSRGNALKPYTQAGFAGQGTDNITNRNGMEPMEAGQEMPKAPAGLPAWRAAQFDRAVQTLFQYPNEVGEFNKRYDPLNSTLGQRILKKYRPRGFDQ